MFLQITDCGVAGKYGFKTRGELRRIVLWTQFCEILFEKLNLVKAVLGPCYGTDCAIIYSDG